MKNNYTVYMHISPSNKRYIGITKQKVNERWRNGKSYKNNKYFTNAINKYGWDNFKHIIIVKGLSEEEAKWLEIELIREFDTTNKNKGYNISSGGESHYGVKCSEETKKKISRANSGKNNPMYGVTSPNKNKKLSEETKMKISKNSKGKKHKKFSKETKMKMSKNHRDVSGENNPFYGKKGKDSLNGKSVICLTTMRIFYTIKDGAEFYNCHASNITRCCKGKIKTCGGLKWKYININHNKILRGENINRLHIKGE